MAKADKFFAKGGVIKAEIVLNAVKGDEKEVKKGAFEYASELAGFTLDALEEATGKAGYKRANICKGLATEAFEYHQRLGELFDRVLDADDEMMSRYLSQKRSFQYLASQLAIRIHAAEALIAQYGDQP